MLPHVSRFFCSSASCRSPLSFYSKSVLITSCLLYLQTDYEFLYHFKITFPTNAVGLLILPHAAYVDPVLTPSSLNFFATSFEFKIICRSQHCLTDSSFFVCEILNQFFSPPHIVLPLVPYIFTYSSCNSFVAYPGIHNTFYKSFF